MNSITAQDGVQNHELLRLTTMVTNGLTSIHSIRAYTRAIYDFLKWSQRHNMPFVKATVQDYRMRLIQEGYGAASINQILSAIRALGKEAGDNNLISFQVARGIENVKGVRKEGTSLGVWLTKSEVETLLSLPDDSLIGKRDRAVLAALVGSGLRRTECAELQTKHLQKRFDRHVLVDILGKRNKLRSIPIADWTYEYINEWIMASGIGSGWVFHGFFKGGKMRYLPITPQAISDIVKKYSRKMGVRFTPHDLRRTFAQLAYQGGSPVKQISLSLGHASIMTTEIYLGIRQNLEDAPADHLSIEI